MLGSAVAYSQRHVRSGMPIDGWTMIDVEVPGTYQITLRRWPKESNLGIRAEAPDYPMHPATHIMKRIPCKVVDAVAARLKVGSLDKVAAVKESDKEITFEVDLPAGEQRIQTWFTMKNGEQIAAYYTYIEPVRRHVKFQ